MKKLAILLVLVLVVSGCTQIIVPPESFTEDNIQLATIMPSEEGFVWNYHGFAEYGHTMSLDTISGDDDYRAFSINGEFLDMSDGESSMDPSITMQYVIEHGQMTQFINGEMIMDPAYQGLIVLQTPLELGTNWEQTVSDATGNEVTLSSEITEIDIVDNVEVYTVLYEDVNSDYYEVRKFRQGSGLIYFEKLYYTEEDSFSITYTLYENNSGNIEVIMNQELATLMPENEGFEWIYSGFVEYGHQMSLLGIIDDNSLITYIIEGEVYDPSVGEATGDYSVNIEYYISNGELRQSINAERLMESEYQDLILIRYPLEIGNSWEQTLYDLNNNQYVFESEIYDITTENNQEIYHVRYEDVNSDYYELREFQLSKGMVAFSMLYEFDNDSVEVGYRLYEMAP